MCYCHPQLIVSVRPSGPPHNPSKVFSGADDGNHGGASSSSATLGDDTEQILKV